MIEDDAILPCSLPVPEDRGPLFTSEHSLSLLPSEPGLILNPVPPQRSVKKKRPRKQYEPVDPGDPICWSWKRYVWIRGLDQLEQMRVLRMWHNRRCGICAKDETDLVIDHDHGTGWVRGLLCDGCNQKEGRARDADDVFARWRACPPAAILGLKVVYESSVRGVALPMPSKHTGPLSLPEWAPHHSEWPLEPWLSFEPSDDDPVTAMTRLELEVAVKRLRRQVIEIRSIVAKGA